MLLIDRALGYPAREDRDLFLCQRLAVFKRRHDLVFKLARDAQDELALIRLPREKDSVLLPHDF